MKHLRDFIIYCLTYLAICLALSIPVDVGQMIIISSIVTVVFYVIDRAQGVQ